MSRKNLFSAADLDGLLGKGTAFAGDLVFENALRLEGRFRGTLRSESAESVLTIGESADVEADVDVGVLLVGGRIVGKIRARDRVEIQPGGKVIGDIRAPNLVTRQGAIFRGNCFIGEEEDIESQPFKTERAFFRGAG